MGGGKERVRERGSMCVCVMHGMHMLHLIVFTPNNQRRITTTNNNINTSSGVLLDLHK